MKNLTVKNSAGLDAVKNVSFQIHAGEVFAVAGVSGNGQNELADSIAGLAKISGGTVTLCGHDITNATVREHITEGVAYIPEDRHNVGLVLDFTLRDNFPLRQYYTPKFSRKGVLSDSEFRTYGEKLEEAYDIRSSLGGATITREMSGGNQQKAIIARELDMKTPLIIFMQPTRGLDAGAVMNIHRHIVDERDRGAAVLLISLDLDEILDCADTIGVIYGGSLNKISPASEITTDEIGLYMMGVKTA